MTQTLEDIGRRVSAVAGASYPLGGSFLVRTARPEEIFTRADFTSEQRMFAKSAKDFMDREVVPLSDRIEAKEHGLMQELIRKAGELGLPAADIPEEYGGLGLDKTTSALIYENLVGQGSFWVVFGGQVGIGSLPVVYYGRPEVKAKYLPSIADGTRIGCFALTEPSAGSDAMSCRTRAVLSEDGKHYILNGTKQFVTNGGIADLFTVFAKVDGSQLSSFLLERDTPGLTIGPEEHKMGIRGTSTTTVLLDDAKVPVENLLGEIGQGHKIAFTILNIGRFKIGSSAAGTCKLALQHALSYCLDRKQFGKRIADFGAIREKFSEMFARTYAAEATAYRTIGLIDQLLKQKGSEPGVASLRSIEEYSIECAIVKVFGTETLDYVVDEALQCFGGYGYCADYPMERLYRDSRINRIFEGTNEINRLLIPTMVLRKAASGDACLREALDGSRGSGATGGSSEEGLLAGEKRVIDAIKEVGLRTLGLASRRYGKALSGEQAIAIRLADLLIAAYSAESTVLRALKDAGCKGPEAASLGLASARILCEEAAEKVHSIAREVLITLEGANGLTAHQATLGRLAERAPVDTLALRNEIAGKLVALERLPLEN